MKKLLVFILFMGLTQATTFAQWESSSSFGLRYVVPTGATADFYDSGYGVTGTSNFSVIPLMDIIFEGSWHQLNGKEITIDGLGNINTDNDMSIYGFVAGPVLTLGIADVGLKGGYFFGDVSEWVLFPFAQVDIFMFSLGAEYKAVGDTEWAAVYLNYNFNW